MLEEESSSLPITIHGLYHLFFTRQGMLSRIQFITACGLLLMCSGIAIAATWVLSTILHALQLKVVVDFLFSVLVVLFFYSLSMLVIKRFNHLHIPPYVALIGLIPIIGTFPLCCSLLFMPGRVSER